jgi:hypothetical protein
MKGIIGTLAAVSPLPDSITNKILKVSILAKPIICIKQHTASGRICRKNENIVITIITNSGNGYLDASLGF